jgi:hypothetical protein
MPGTAASRFAVLGCFIVRDWQTPLGNDARRNLTSIARDAVGEFVVVVGTPREMFAEQFPGA